MSLGPLIAAVAASDTTGYEPPTSREFELGRIVDGAPAWLTKPVLLLVLAALIVAVFFWATSRRASVVPGRGQFLGEMVYGGIRNTVARDVIGREFLAYVPLLVTLFSFILVNNLFGVVPFLQFPTMSRVGFPIALGLIVWVLYNGIGIRRHGFGGYVRQMTLPPGVPIPVLILLAPIEFFSTVIVRPLTLSVRLFANMFAGHLLLIVFIGGGAYMLHHGPVFVKVAGPLSMTFAIVLSFFEMFIEFLQAFIFTLLVALYISGALAEEH